MPTWAQIFFALFPIAVLVLAAAFWVVRRIAHLEGKVDAILSLLGLIVKAGRIPGEEMAKTHASRPTGPWDARTEK